MTQNSKRQWKSKGEAKKPEAPKLDPILEKAEKIVIGTMMLHPHLLDQHATAIGASDFAKPMHQRAFEALVRLRGLGKPVNKILVRDAIEDGEDMPIDGLNAFLNDIYEHRRTQAGEIIDYIATVLLWAKRRAAEELAKLCTDLAKGGSHDLLEQIQQTVSAQISKGSFSDVFAPMGDYLTASLGRAFEQNADGWQLTGISTGFQELDDAIGGFQPNKLYILAAMEKAGKSSLGLAFARQILDQGKAVGFVSLEMKRDEIADRIIMQEAEVKIGHRPRGHIFTQDEVDRLDAIREKMQTLALYCSELGAMTPSAIRSACRQIVRHQKQPVEAIFVDYLQIIGSESGKDEQRRRVEEASGAMVEMAKELGVPVIALAQLNREALKRNSGKTWADFDVDASRPRAGDLRETAKIEGDAHAIIALYRPEMLLEKMRPFNPKPEEEIEFEEAMRPLKGFAELSLIVNRSGASHARAEVSFRGDIMKFSPRQRAANGNGKLNAGYGDHMTSQNMRAR